MKIGFYGIIFILLFSGCLKLTGDTEKTRARSALKAWVDESKGSTAAVIGVIDDKGTRFFSYGKTEKKGVPVHEETLFEIGSLTKLFTALLLAVLDEEGAVDMDAPVWRYLPESRPYLQNEGRPVTLRHLASHTSGLPRIPENMGHSDFANPYASFGEAELSACLKGYPLKGASLPGESYGYSNLGYGLLGYLMEKVTQTPYEELLYEKVLNPLGLGRTRISADGLEMARPHGPFRNPVPVWDFDVLAGCGALKSSARDLLRFLSLVMEHEENPLKRSVEKTLREERPLEPGVEGDYICLGWHKLTLANGEPYYIHDGGTGGSRSFLIFDNEKRKGAVILTNSAKPHDDLIDFVMKEWMQ